MRPYSHPKFKVQLLRIEILTNKLDLFAPHHSAVSCFIIFRQ